MRLGVALLTGDPLRAQRLAVLVEAAGHVVVVDGADVLLADGDAIPLSALPVSSPVIVLGNAGPDAPYAGLLPRNPTPRQLDAAFRGVAAGLKVRMQLRPARGSFRAVEDISPVLTPRELEILAAIGLGLSNKEVARRLAISVHTVKFHLEASFRKLGATGRADAVAKGLRRGLIEV